MNQKPENKMDKINKIQGRKKDKKIMVDFYKETVSHGSKFQKDLHCKFFFEES